MQPWVVLLFSLPLVFCDSLPEFTNEEFDKQVKGKKFFLIMFYAPWCGHCKKLKPAFLSVGEKLLDNKDVGLALVDCTTQEKLCSRFQVSGYPTLKLFKHGEHFHDYDGSRDESGLLNYILTRTQPPSVELENSDNLSHFLGSDIARDNPALITLAKSKTDSLLDVHSKVASDLLGLVSFAHAYDAAVFGEVLDGNLIRLYRPKKLVNKLTEPFVDYNGKLDAKSIYDWILNNGHGLVGYRTPSNLKLFPNDNILLFYHNASIDKHSKGVNYYRNRLIQAMKQPDIDVSGLAFAYCFSDDFYHEISDLQPGHVEYPLVVIRSANKKFLLEKYDHGALLQFLKSFKAGSLEPYIKSEPIPTDQKGPAIKVVGRNFDAVVNDNSKDVFIMFHAPWCGHCKQLMPKYETVAEKLKSEPGLLMVTYDATANEVPDPYEVRGYPTLYFARKSSKTSPKLYEGAREVDDLIKFVSKESTEELEGYDRNGKPKKADL